MTNPFAQFTDAQLVYELNRRAERRLNRGDPGGILTLSGYQNEAERTTTLRDSLSDRLVTNGLAPFCVLDRASQERLMRDRDFDLVAMGLCGEAGEVADLLKKHVHHGKPLDRVHYVEELGDTLWYVSMGASVVGASLEEVVAANSAKARKRFPAGFSFEAANARADKVSR